MIKLLFRPLIAFALFYPALPLSAAPEPLQQTTTVPTVVRYYSRGALDSLHNYKYELIKLALDITRSQYGDYILDPYGSDPGAPRLAQLINDGKIVNLLWASPGTPIAKANVIGIPIDIMHNLLGFRICFTHQETKSVLEKVNDVNSLRMIKIGQGRNWSDIKIYKHNRIEPITTPEITNALGLLGKKRIDCFPMGATEVLPIFNEQRKHFPYLSIDNNLLIYYDYPIYFYISKTEPELAKRMKEGLLALQKNGEFNALFQRYFAKDLLSLHLNSRKIICLKSPYTNHNTQCQDSITNTLLMEIKPAGEQSHAQR
jgi:ABC-type amino acid transport substrate-binding protein